MYIYLRFLFRSQLTPQVNFVVALFALDTFFSIIQCIVLSEDGVVAVRGVIGAAECCGDLERGWLSCSVISQKAECEVESPYSSCSPFVQIGRAHV